jgi:hypothetical protein
MRTRKFQNKQKERKNKNKGKINEIETKKNPYKKLMKQKAGSLKK